MTDFVSGQSRLAAGLCEALGLDPKQTREFTLDVPSDGLLTLTATLIVTDEQARAVSRVVREWKLTLSEAPE